MATLSTTQKNNLKGVKHTNLSHQSIQDFCALYMTCEATARKLIKYYKDANGLPVKQNFSILEVNAAVRHFGLTINQPIIDKIFKSGDGIRNSKTCRQLRNSFFHTLQKEDRQEIIDRFVDLKSDMDTWLNLF